MKHKALVDAGPLVALLNASDPDHESGVKALEQLRTPLITTWAPVTEALYLLDFSIDAQSALLKMLEREALEVLTLELTDVAPIRALMHKYADLPMDFADATLVQAANRLGIRHVFTLDRRDFSVYRLPRGRSFIILPA